MSKNSSLKRRSLERSSSNSSSFSTRMLIFSAACIALSTVLANFASFHLPFGGSITLFSMFFVSLPGYLFGPVTGFCAAVAHGLIQFLSNPYVVHPLQVILDYFLAFGALGVSGLFYRRKNGLIMGYITGVLGRFFFSALSGVIFYTEYIGIPGTDAVAVLSGILYNLSYMGPEAAVTVALLFVPPVKNAISYIRKLASN